MVETKPKFGKYGYLALVIGGSVLVAVILGVVAVRPLYASLKKTNDELDEKKAVLEKLESNLANLKSLDSRKDEIKEKNAKVLSALPQDKDVPRLFIQMEKIAAGAGLAITSVSEGTTATGTTAPAATAETTAGTTVSIPTINPHYYTVTGTAGSYTALRQALSKIEDGLRLISIEKVDVSGSQSGGSLTVNLSVKTYSRGGTQ